jgi:hypothetical protein
VQSNTEYRIGQPARSPCGEFDLAIMIAVADRRDAWPGLNAFMPPGMRERADAFSRVLARSWRAIHERSSVDPSGKFAYLRRQGLFGLAIDPGKEQLVAD